MKKIVASIALAVLTCTALTGPAGALHKPGGGGSCTRWVYYTNTAGWPQYRCTSYTYR